MVNPLPSSGVLHRIKWRGTSPCGDSFAVVSIIDAVGSVHWALASRRRFGDLIRLSGFEGLRVNLVATANGLELMSIADQVSPEQQLQENGLLEASPQSGDVPVDVGSQVNVLGISIDAVGPTAEAIPLRKLWEVVATVAKLARGIKLPTVKWIDFS